MAVGQRRGRELGDRHAGDHVEADVVGSRGALGVGEYDDALTGLGVEGCEGPLAEGAAGVRDDAAAGIDRSEAFLCEPCDSKFIVWAETTRPSEFDEALMARFLKEIPCRASQ